MLCSARPLSLTLDGQLDLSLVHSILGKLPSTLKRLCVRGVTQSDAYQFPSQVNLKSLYFEDSLTGVAQLFTVTFPQLMTISIMSRFQWSENDIRSLHEAVIEGRLPRLQHLSVKIW